MKYVTLLFLWALAPGLFAQTPRVQGSIAAAPNAADSTRVVVYGRPNVDLSNTVFENIHICISIAEQNLGYPNVYIHQNHVPALEWIAAADNPRIADGRAYYTFVGVDNQTNTPVDWTAGADNPILELGFQTGSGKAAVQLNDLTDAGGIGSGGGPAGLSFWYVQANGWGDVTNYTEKFCQHAGSTAPENGGLAAPSHVQTTAAIALPTSDKTDESAWRLYPNPTAGPLSLMAPETGAVTLRIVDLTGRLVWMHQTTVFEQKNTTLEVHHLPGGRYVLDVLSGDGRSLYRGIFSKI